MSMIENGAAYGSLLKPEKTVKPPRGDTSDLRRIAHDQADGRCQADGLHHPDCPQHVDNGGEFVAHHIWPSGKGGGDDAANLLWVWNGLTRLGAGGCHSQIHVVSRKARALGLLRFGSDDRWFGVGVDVATRAGWLK